MQELVLLFHARSIKGLLPISAVAEVMRRLPVDSVPDAPPFVLGLTIIRGKPVPVVDLGALIGAEGRPSPTRFVLIRLGQRSVALAVEELLGIDKLDSLCVEEMPPLLRQARPETVQGLAALDGQLHLVLKTSRLVPESVFRKATA